ncbi:MAG: MupG family TIM beta-alpha barrel fold protein [Enterococcus sp.]
MFGFSIFMNEPLTIEKKEYIQQMACIGFEGIFTSMHIPEDDATTYAQKLQELGKVARENDLKLMVDISGEALTRAGFSFNKLQNLLQLGVTGLRMDYEISMEQIAKCSHELTVSLNASTVTPEDIAKLKALNADFSNLEAWHNYYPRPETGLDKKWFFEKNKWLHEQGFTVQAFVPGDANLRGPLYEGLPTLEEHRHLHPLAGALALLKLDVDLVYIGDGGLQKKTQRQFSNYSKEKEITLHVKQTGSHYFKHILGQHINRQDDARDVVRSAHARFKEIPFVEVEPEQPRIKGSVTLDNKEYLRYMGEIQLVKHPLAADRKVNVVAQVIPQDLALIDCIGAGNHYQFIEDEGQIND